MTDRQIRGAIDGLFKQRKSPLEGYGAYFWVLGRFHGIDGRLVVGIAGAETSFATDPHMTPADLPGHNAWGYGHRRVRRTDISSRAGKTASPPSHSGSPRSTWPRASTRWRRSRPKWVGIPSPNWINNVTAIMQELGGDPNKLACTNLAKSP
jgi:hypothetical protein